MTISTNIHGVEGIRADNYYPGNAHSVRLRIEARGAAWEITTFDLTEAKALAVLHALGDEMTTVYTPTGTISLRDYLTERSVHKALDSDPA